ncbi:TPA: discoidin domain-containing protein [Clostridium perfringens]|uniref:discoidin domain-containing protein n=1 Tax=Clostridium perfringens TaxID=1502 RepID=UPI001A225F98|nr:discoidin domain-containing protein [Clostridium perfringens]HAT4271170.1 discoidin domain-containing protein [Clostridium perfringens]
MDKAIDGDFKTHWETEKSNSNNFNNEVEVTFKNNTKLIRAIYWTRSSDNKGFAEQFEIYGSTTYKGDTYQLVATGSYFKTSGFIEAKFKETEFKRLKFVFKKFD